MKPRDLAVLFAIGAVVGTSFDYIHVYAGVTAYTHPDFHGTVLWLVPLQFGLCALVGGLAIQALAKHLPPPAVNGWRVAFDLGLLLVGYLATAYWVGENEITFAALVPVALASVASRPTLFVAVVSAAGAVLGPLGEIALRSAGFFRYVHADPVPLWLPLLWTIAAGGFLSVPLWLAQKPPQR